MTTTTTPQDGRTASLRVRLTPEELRALKLFCVSENINASDLVRGLLEDYMSYRKETNR